MDLLKAALIRREREVGTQASRLQRFGDFLVGSLSCSSLFFFLPTSRARHHLSFRMDSEKKTRTESKAIIPSLGSEDQPALPLPLARHLLLSTPPAGAFLLLFLRRRGRSVEVEDLFSISVLCRFLRKRLKREIKKARKKRQRGGLSFLPPSPRGKTPVPSLWEKALLLLRRLEVEARVLSRTRFLHTDEVGQQCSRGRGLVL